MTNSREKFTRGPQFSISISIEESCYLVSMRPSTHEASTKLPERLGGIELVKSLKSQIIATSYHLGPQKDPGNPFISEKSRLVTYYSLARLVPFLYLNLCSTEANTGCSYLLCDTSNEGFLRVASTWGQWHGEGSCMVGRGFGAPILRSQIWDHIYVIMIFRYI